MPARTKRDDGTYEYLFPERYSEEWYTSNYATLGPYSSAGLLDCDPKPASGNACKAEWFEVVDAVPASFDNVIRWWDLAATASKNADYTTGTFMGVSKGVFYLVDQHRSQTGAGSIIDLVYNYGTRDGLEVPIGIEQEGGSSGKILSSAFAKRLAGWSLLFVKPTGDKLTRALPFFAQAAAGNVKLLRGPWNKAFLDEVTQAPDGANDDTWDSAAGAFSAISRSRSI
jgi:predicted phage terminase large subunit-like protein